MPCNVSCNYGTISDVATVAGAVRGCHDHHFVGGASHHSETEKVKNTRMFLEEYQIYKYPNKSVVF